VNHLKLEGFVDLQVNGYKGIDFSNPNLQKEDIKFVSKELLKLGVIGYCPTLISSKLDTYKHNLPLLAEAMNDQIGAQMLGIHLEGPFINPRDGVRGIHLQENIIAPSIDIFDKLYKWSNGKIAILTIAPEINDSFKLIEYIANKKDIVISIGHTTALNDVIVKAINLGVKAATHVGNGLQNRIHRHNNPLWPILANDHLYGLFVTDSFHIPYELIKVALRSKGASKFIVTSDLVHIAGLKPGLYDFHGEMVVLENSGLLRCQDSNYLAGSTQTMIDCMNYISSFEEVNIEELYKIGYENPLKLINKVIKHNIKDKIPELHYSNKRFTINNLE
jgi:N-acetylglucosamine-6-phosphate deacetylase